MRSPPTASSTAAAIAKTPGSPLETTATRLWSEPGGPHYGSPDKDPEVRLRTLADAGRLSIPFTTGLLVGGVAGALLGRTIDTRGDRTVGTLGGAGAKAAGGTEIVVDGEDLLVLRESDVLAKVAG